MDDGEWLGAGGGAEFVEGGGEVGGKCVLGIGGQLVALAGQIEDVDRRFAFGIDQRDLNIALVIAERESDLAQQAGAVLRHDLQQRRVRGRFGVELQARRHFNFDVPG